MEKTHQPERRKPVAVTLRVSTLKGARTSVSCSREGSNGKSAKGEKEKGKKV